MRVAVSHKPVEALSADVAVALYRPDEDLPLAGHLRDDAAAVAVADEGGMTWFDATGLGASRVLLVSLGDTRTEPGRGGPAGSMTPEDVQIQERHEVRALGAAIERACNAQGRARVVLAAWPEDVDPSLLVEGMVLRGHATDEWRESSGASAVEKITVALPKKSRAVATRIRDAARVAGCTNWARGLNDMPSNVGTPKGVVDRVRPVARRVGLHVKVFSEKQAERMGMGLFCAVTRGSEHPGKILVLEHQRDRADELPTVVLLGKGITHDTGGYNIKTSGNMHELTYDKSGAMAVVGAMRAVAELGLEAHVVGVCPFAENCVDARAFKPGEILTALDGTTVYVENTDAEGRLVLADALVWAQQLEPDLAVDLATLTGACMVGLGDPYAGLYANDDAARDLVLAAGRRADDLLWPMPIHEMHDRELAHHRADLKNTGGYAGAASAAAAFLRHFVDYPWAHVDMAGKGAWEVDHDYRGPGATGFGCRLLVEVVRAMAARGPAKQ